MSIVGALLQYVPEVYQRSDFPFGDSAKLSSIVE